MRLTTAVLLLTLLAPARPAAPAPPPPDPLQAMLDAKALKGAYNPVLLDYLAKEGKSKLPAKQANEAIAQLVATFKEQVQIRPGEQVAAGLATLAGLLAGGTVGAGVREGAAEVWSSWVDSAYVLAGAGYKAEAATFFQRCIETFPYDHLQARCAAGLAVTEPERGFELLTGLLGKERPIEVTNMALRLLGDLAAAEGCPPERKAAVLAELSKRTEGMLNSSYYEAAVDGLVRTHDPRAVEPLRKMTKGMSKGEDVKRAALRGLAVGFQDAGAIDTLQKSLKGGFGKDEADKVFAGIVLIRAGQQSGFDWARDYLGKAKKKGLLSTSKDVDYSSDVAAAVIEKGGEPAKAVLAAGIAGHKPDEWLTAFMAIGLLELGDASRIDLVKAPLAAQDWPRTRVRAAVALAGQKDYSGIPVLKAMCVEPGLGKKALELAAGSYRDPEAARIAVADALGSVDHADGVPILASLLDDKSEQVRLTAAFALMRMKDASALDPMPKLLATDFGKFEGRSRNPEVQAAALRAAGGQFPSDARTRALIKKGSESANPSVKFLALVQTKSK